SQVYWLTCYKIDNIRLFYVTRAYHCEARLATMLLVVPLVVTVPHRLLREIELAEMDKLTVPMGIPRHSVPDRDDIRGGAQARQIDESQELHSREDSHARHSGARLPPSLERIARPDRRGAVQGD